MMKPTREQQRRALDAIRARIEPQLSRLDRETAPLRGFMRSIVADHVDPRTGEVNCTGLAEATAHHFGHDEWLDDDTHIVWDLAIDVAEFHGRS